MTKRKLLLSILLLEVVLLALAGRIIFSATPPASTSIYRQGTKWSPNPTTRPSHVSSDTYNITTSSNDASVKDGATHPPWDSINLTVSDLGTGQTGTDYYGAGLRFLNIPIRRQSTIDLAYLNFTASSTRSGTTVRTNLQGEDVGDAEVFSDVTDFNSRTRTTALVAWDGIAKWWEGTVYQSPNIKTIIQEIVNRDDWSNGNALVIFWEDNGSDSGAFRQYYSYDGDSTKTVELEVSWHMEGLNSTFTFSRSLEMNNISYSTNNNLRMFKDSQGYWINTTSGSDMKANINNWFDQYGTEMEITSSGTYTLDVYVGSSKGQPETVEGVDSWSYNSTTNIVTFTATSSSSQVVRMHWSESGATTKILSPTFTGHRSLTDDTNLNGFGLVAGRSHPYTFETKVWIANGEKVERVILELCTGLTREIELECEAGSFMKKTDAFNYYTIKTLDCDLLDEDDDTIYWSPYHKWFKIHWVGYFNPNYSPRNYLESTKTTVVVEPTTGGSETSYDNTEIEQYYISSTISIESLDLTNPSIDTDGIIAEYKDYTWQAVIKSTIDYNDVNYVQMILGYGTEHEVVLAWIREVDKDLTTWHPSSYEEITTENFTEQEDLKNMFSLNDDDSKIEGYITNYPDDNTTYVRISYVGMFMLQHPSRKLQDVKIVAVAYENNEEKTRTFTDVYWVETRTFLDTTASYGTYYGWLGDNPLMPWAGDLTHAPVSDHARSEYMVPNFQYWAFEHEFRFYADLPIEYNCWTEYWIRTFNESGSAQQQLQIKIKCINIGVSDVTFNITFADYGIANGVAYLLDSVTYSEVVSLQYWDACVEFWIDDTNTKAGLRYTNLVASEGDPEYYQKYYDLKLDYEHDREETNFLELNPWVEVVIASYSLKVSQGGKIEISHVFNHKIQNEQHEGIQEPPIILPADRASWGAFEWLRKGLMKLADMIYWALKPLLDAIVNALTGIFTTIFTGITALWNIIVTALDGLLYAITGTPNLFSTAISTLMAWFGYLGDWLWMFGAQIANIALVIYKFLEIGVYFVVEAIKVIVWFMASAFRAIPDSIKLFFAFFTGTSTVVFGRTVDFTTVGALTRASLIILGATFPIMYMNHIFGAIGDAGIMGGINQFKEDLMMLKGIFDGLFWVFEWIWQKFREIYGFLKSHIPTLGGT